MCIEFNLQSSYLLSVVNLQKKRWYFFVWDEDNISHLERHRVALEEAEQLFFNPYIITPNKFKHQPRRFRIDGMTNSHRHLRLIIEDLGQNTARIITGWDL
jgi:uncharacterized DUF497 family protein